ncbi:UDP-N-acetylmuramoyl-L-alanine--D-glutamate ligase [Cerasicoccus fimbriatus]|uniref:UDP-N-acetylmuramoyl-L-alanine--D-glutamate ligase n=1 Tax=Cerasicoccus fimbriatus TaxID=3014554 RepID=UPI0022B5CC89|nr:UDP-N-acetylmuramoyl-L-alanine--D-glutamate ligase [Cerasicoccus sp. TK19100]
MTRIAKQIPDLQASPAAVLGAGVSGLGAMALLRSQGAWVNLFDERGTSGAKTDFTERDAKQHRVVVHSPGFAPSHPWLVRARSAGAKVYGELDFASMFWPGGLVAVTGVNGKTTLTEFLVHALKNSGTDALAAGNIGYPLSRFFETAGAENTVAVCEVSSFQAEVMHAFRPQAVLWTNFAEDHLERHGSMKNYFAAKWRLVERLARPHLIIGPSVAQWAAELGFALPTYTKIVNVDAVSSPADSPFARAPQRENYAIARAYWEAEGNDMAELEAAARTFKLPAHRLELIAECEGVKFYDDSKATNFHAAEAGLIATDEPVIWIGGGRRKGGDIAGFAQRIARKVHFACLIGESAAELAEALTAAGTPNAVLPNLPDAVREAWKRHENGGSILLSPGFSSHDQFSSYAERGECFKQAVLSLKGVTAATTVTECVKS